MNNILNDLDKALIDLSEIAIEAVEEAKTKKIFSKDFAEAVGIVFSLAYGRFGDDK